MNSRKTIFITGVSTGFGKALALEAIAAGHRVIGTLRSEAALQAFESLSRDQAHGVILDVTDFGRIESVVAAMEAAHGPVDVLVNNAGYGHEGIFEESPLEEMRRQFDVNVFGAFAPSPIADAARIDNCFNSGVRGRLRKRLAIQPRIQTFLRTNAPRRD